LNFTKHVHGCVMETPKDAKNNFNPLVAVAIKRYSASAEDLETIVCFLVCQEIGDPPMETRYPVRDHRVIGQVSQSASQYALTCRWF